MADILLTTLNARWAHCAFGLRYLLANLGPLASHAALAEFDINQRSVDVLESILQHQPRIVGLGVYVWNASQSLPLVAELKRVRPDILVVLGGPEVSHETQAQEIVRYADYVITGEADWAFAELCAKLLRGERPLMKVIPAELPVFEALKLPYDLYEARDLTQRTVYVEASRGCPFACEFCLSALEVPVRAIPPELFLGEMEKLLARGLRHFKFVDRTFNLNLTFSRTILEFFLQRYEPGMFLHFEMVPDRLPESLREVIAKFPAGALQFEVGVQTFNEAVAARISRRQDAGKVAENLRWLRAETGVYVHADLIVGLPGEDVASFAAGFDRLCGLQPHEIQIELLKRLRGAPIARHDQAWGMVYSPHPPYEVLQTSVIDFATMQRLRRLARYWDLVANSGNFVRTLELVLGNQPFAGFMGLSDWLHAQVRRSHGIALGALLEAVFRYLTVERRCDAGEVARRLWEDYQRGGRSDMPVFLRPYLTADRANDRRGDEGPKASEAGVGLPRRQGRRQKGG